MARTLAKQGDDVVAVDTHIVMVTTPSGPVATPLPSPFRGPLSSELSTTVFADDKAAATEGSKAQNASPHVPQGGSFQKTPANEASVAQGSATVFIDDKPAARNGDPATTCNDPTDLPIGKIMAGGTVLVDEG